MARSGQSNHRNNSSVHARPDGRQNKSARARNFAFSADRGFVMHQGSGTRVHRRGGIPEPAYADLVRQYTRARVANASDCQRYFQPECTGVRCLPYKSRPPCWTEHCTRDPHTRDRKGPTAHTVDFRIKPRMVTHPSTPSSRK
jgi:hypothetical protein